jgi:hypothetical protein
MGLQTCTEQHGVSNAIIKYVTDPNFDYDRLFAQMGQGINQFGYHRG